ncbi:MAG: pyridoxine 5'-phosphate synthase [Deltaproteobacteria bacterium CG_4_10_14_0_2_um_filter_43_8]|nr:MAG: pyridoxine 5'-phosphate synthase [Deltaproteobacteria bacterium CG11_big_fil_rev_8_21_14_0_20_42_23]PJA20389.1 MAG: pyridoxine 5'-phosphate synthase [Deltaproteobacteria bacterium CG_4_10_14_0_2_um_filter_43_8]PJC63788.1 MAG: pyridoxine 5'-phosphate synthase [Deltaproteobacteria bacterium CG_4_9_14_0_2_um_filter_42_21]
MPLLGVNIDHAATLREARKTTYPNVLDLAKLAITSGADQITIHLREDRRHIQDADVWLLKQEISVPLNLEMSLAPDIIDIACQLKPARVTIVPERREELTTEGGLNLTTNSERLAHAIERLQKNKIEISLFIDPEQEQIALAKTFSVPWVELHTGAYAERSVEVPCQEMLSQLKEAAQFALACGFQLAAGHGLNYHNVRHLVEAVPEIQEYNIGHAVMAKSLFVGIEAAVKKMKELVQ